jgi:glyoxylase-like metal-dependent hydrolase (beta-lactamase superfamily II)
MVKSRDEQHNRRDDLCETDARFSGDGIMADKPKTYAPGLYGVIGPASNVYVVEDDASGLTVIDAGMPGYGRRILGLVRHLGYGPQDVKQILVTHSDLDHVGGLKSLVDATGAAVYASPESAKCIRARRNPPHMKMPMAAVAMVVSWAFRRGVPVRYEVSDGELLNLAGGIRVIATPGHTPDHTCYFWERERVLFAGDLLHHVRDLALTPDRITWNRADARQSAHKVLALDPAIICIGHGPVWLAKGDPNGISALLESLNSGQ